ncbi:unnamed protein product [Auanema sp. JU1783]|nr:unnamed protein product [Auanema sp. JU1783]
MMKKHLIAILLVWQSATTCGYRSARLRRQVIPSQHIQVHSLESSVLLQDLVVVDSSENRIDLDEAKVKGSIWSDKSLLSFDSQDTFVNVSAENVDSFFNIQNCAMLHAQAGDTDFFMRSNRTEDGNSAITQTLNKMANFSIVDEGLNVQAVGGRRVELEAQSWERNIDKEMSLSSFTSPMLEKIVQLKAVASPYNIEARFFGSTIFISFADKVIRIDPLTKNIIIFTDKFTVEVRVNETDYGVTMNPREVVVALPMEETTVCIDLSGVTVQARKLAKTTIERNGGEMNVGGLFTNADSVQINSLSTELTLTNEGKTTAEALNSEMMMSNPLQKIHLASAHHRLGINGGVPHIFIEPGYICVDIKANHGMPHFMNIMPPFIAPEDKFVNIGPFGVLSAVNDMNAPPSPVFASPPMNLEPHDMQVAPPPLPVSSFQRKVVPDFELFKGMAADLPQQKPPTLSNITSPLETATRSTDNSSTAAPVTTAAPKRKVTIDMALLHKFAADLPQNRTATNQTVETMIETTTLPSTSAATTISTTAAAKTTMAPETSTVKTTTEIPQTTTLTTTQSTTTSTVSTTLSTTTSTTTTTTEEPTTSISTTTTQLQPTKPVKKNKITVKTEDDNTTHLSNETNTITEDISNQPITTLPPQTTTVPPTTSSDPIAELAKLRAELKRIETLREWEEQQVSQDHDGDEQLEEFTYPNGTTVQRRIKTRRKIVTTVTHRHKQRIDENGKVTNLTPDTSSAQNHTVVRKLEPKAILKSEMKLTTNSSIAPSTIKTNESTTGKTRTTLTTLLFPRGETTMGTAQMTTVSSTTPTSTSDPTITVTTVTTPTTSSTPITPTTATTANNELLEQLSSTTQKDDFIVTQYGEDTTDSNGKIKDYSNFNNYVRLYSKITMSEPPQKEEKDKSDFPKPESLIHYRPHTSESRQIRNPFYKQENVDKYVIPGFLKKNGPFDGYKTGTEEESQDDNTFDYVDASNDIIYAPHIYTSKLFGSNEDKKSKRLFMVRLTIPDNVKITNDDIVKRLDFNFQHISESLSEKFLNRERRESKEKNPYEISMIEMRKRADTLSVVFGMDKNVVENEVLKEIALSHRFSFQPFEVLLFAENVAPVNTSMRGFVLCSICAILCIFYYAWKSHRRASNSRSNIPRVPLEGDEEEYDEDGEEGNIEDDDEEDEPQQ